MAARAAAPHLSGLAEAVLPRLPRRPRASQNLRSICRDPSSAPMLLDDAITCPWLAWDSETHRNALLVDVDHDGALDRWLDLREDVRSMLVLDPWSGRAHAVAVLEDPALLKTRKELEAERTGTKIEDGARALLGPQMMADLAGRLLAAALGGTLLPPGSLVKNPWGQTKNLIGIRRQLGPRPLLPERWAEIQTQGLMWATLPGAGPLKLRDLVGALADQWWSETAGASKRFTAKRFAKKRGDPSWLSRNTWVFDLTRWWAYDHAETDGGAILETALRFNAELAQPLPTSDVRATARSITRFMTTRYRPRHGEEQGPRRDREAGAALDAKARQALAGARTAQARAAATDARIAGAVVQLRAAGAPLTQAAVAAAAGLSLRTLKGRWHAPAMVQDASLSGGAAQAAPPAPGRASSEAKESLSALAGRDRAIRLTVAALRVAAAAARRPGADSAALPSVSPDLLAVPDVRRARREAEAALASARRRAEARADRSAAARRRAEMVEAITSSDDLGRAWWRRATSDLGAVFDRLEADAAGDRDALARLVRQRDAAFGALASQWRAAQRDVARDRLAAEPVAEIPW